MKIGKLESCFNHFQKAYNLFNEANEVFKTRNERLFARNLMHLANHNVKNNNISDAIAQYKKALTIYIQLNDFKKQVYIYNKLNELSIYQIEIFKRKLSH